MDVIRHPIVELRQYVLRPGQRDVLIDLFDRELVEPQEAAGMAIVGQFRDLDRPDRFVWIRGFADMQTRAEALHAFYGGPVWKAHRDAANATMLDVDDVLLLRPTGAHAGFPAPTVERAPAEAAAAPPGSLVLATLYFRDRPFDTAFVDFFEREVRPVLAGTGAAPLACLQTEYADNTFPALPVRTGEHAFAWFARLNAPADLVEHHRQLAQSEHFQNQVWPRLSAKTVGPPQQFRLVPTNRSQLR
jgi:hypothetical protein